MFAFQRISICSNRIFSSAKLKYFSGAANILVSDLPSINIPKVPIQDYVFEHVGKWENHIAAECSVTGMKITYNQLRKQSRNLNKALRKKLKLQKGDVVAIFLPNTPNFAVAALGALKAGLIVTTLNPLYTADEIARQLLDSSAKAIITLTDFCPLANSALSLAKKAIPILAIKTKQSQDLPGGVINFDEFTNSEIDLEDVKDIVPEDIAFLPYSSGTTGLPKGVQLTHGNITANLCQLDDPNVTVCKITTNDHQDVVPAVLPFFHIYGFTVTTVHLLRRGNKIVTLPKFTPELYISVLRNHKPDVLFLAPPIAIFLGAHPSVTKKDLSSINSIFSGAAPLGALDEERLLKKAEKDIKILQGYGLTETSPLVCCTRHTGNNPSGSIGKPCANTEVKLVSVDNPNGPALGPNEPGELLVKGPQVMKGYHNRPEETQDTFVGEWLRTGDMMYYNNEGFLFVTDRLKELIKVKGYQVAPAELEEVIRSFPGVAEAAVIGIPDGVKGEVPRAYVVGKSNNAIDVSKLMDFVRDRVAPYKQLQGGVEIVESIPKNTTGKILRRELKRQFIEGK